ncbi:MAG: glucosamine-6-phosphate deaminase, partial [Clostridiales bacterium]|nr:glucosamine-6-phosphate deaminase [Clostridiales bacterium]
HNGHIGFNEPGTPFESTTSVVELTQSTKEANSRYFDSIDDVPTHAISMGMKTIMHAKKILLIAKGEDKAEIMKEALFGPITPDVPASVLQLHPNVTVFVDQKAGSKF